MAEFCIYEAFQRRASKFESETKLQGYPCFLRPIDFAWNWTCAYAMARYIEVRRAPVGGGIFG